MSSLCLPRPQPLPAAVPGIVQMRHGMGIAAEVERRRHAVAMGGDGRQIRGRQDQAIGQGGERDQRIVADGEVGLQLRTHDAVEVNVARFAEQTIERRAIGCFVKASFAPARFGRLVDRQVVMIEFDQVGADDEGRFDGRALGGGRMAHQLKTFVLKYSFKYTE